MKKKRKLKIGRLAVIIAVIFIFFFFVIEGFGALFHIDVFTSVLELVPDLYNKRENYSSLMPPAVEADSKAEEVYIPVLPEYTDYTVALGEEIESSSSILVCVDDGEVLASRNSLVKMYPASMTKIMALIVAVEHIENFDDTFTMTYEIINPLYLQNATVTGLTSGETVPITDLLYGAILPSGADATDALALYTAGDNETFVEWMNDKVKELGLENTHFTNTSGLHDENHYTTAYDMAVILDYAMHSEICREVLGAVKHTTVSTDSHPAGVEMYSTMYSKIHRDQIDGVEIVGGKTGYTYEAGHCLASCAEKDGKLYIAVTGGGENKYSPIYDAIELYSEYTY